MPIINLLGGSFDQCSIWIDRTMKKRPFIEVRQWTSKGITVHLYQKVPVVDNGFIWVDANNVEFEIEKYNRVHQKRKPIFPLS